MLRLTSLLSALLLAAIASGAHAQGQNYVSPYTRSDGTQVQGHNRTNPNSTPNDNWTTRPNVNPYTGQAGTRDPAPSYGSGSRSGGSSYSYGR